MHISMLYNVFVCFVAGFSGLLVFKKVLEMRYKSEQGYNKGIDYFLLSFGILWILVGVRIFLVWLGYPHLDRAVWHFVVGPLTYFHILPLFYYFGFLFFQKDTYRIAFVSIFGFITLFAVLALFLYGFELAETTYWGTKYDANEVTHRIFTFGIFVPALFCIFFEFFRRFKAWKKDKKFIDKQLLGINAALLIYALVAVFDGLAIASGWTLLLVRVGIMVSALIIYFFITEEDYENI